MGELIFKESDPNAVLFEETIYEVDAKAGLLRIYLPFAGREDLNLEQGNRELVVGVRNEYRRFPMPAEFSEKENAGARFEGGYLNILFE